MTYFYIGYPKSGATRLRNFLEETDGLTLLKISQAGIAQDLVGSPAPITHSEEAANRHVREVLDASPSGKPKVVFSERLSGLCFCGHYDALSIADRIHRFCPDGRVIISIREQHSMISSIYRWYVRNGGTLPPELFLNPRESITYPRFSWQAYEYHHLILHYAQRFGRENVLVLPQEDLKADSRAYFRTFCDFLGIDCPADIPDQIANRGISNEETEKRRLLNLVRKNADADAFRDPTPLQHPLLMLLIQPWVRLFAPLIARRNRHVKFIREHFTGSYRDSNQRLSDYLGRDLSRIGYEM